MGLENVVKDILDQARSEVDLITSQADEEAAAIINKANIQAKKIKEEKQTEVEAQIIRMKKQDISSTRLETKRAVLNARKDILDSVFQYVRDNISSLPDKKNADLLKVILKNNESNGTSVYSNKKDAELVKKMTSLTYMGEIDCIGGLMIENDDGSIRLDFTYDRILDDVSDQSLKQISEILFG